MIIHVHSIHILDSAASMKVINSNIFFSRLNVLEPYWSNC